MSGVYKMASGETRYSSHYVKSTGLPYAGVSKGHRGYDELEDGYYTWEHLKYLKRIGVSVELPTPEEKPAAFVYLRNIGANHYLGLYERKEIVPILEQRRKEREEEEERRRILWRTKQYEKLKEKNWNSRVNFNWKKEWRGVVDMVKIIGTGNPKELNDFKTIMQNKLRDKYDFYSTSDFEEIDDKEYKVEMEISKKREVKSYHTRVAGISYEGREDIARLVTKDTPISLERDPNNEYDSNAIKIMVEIEGELQSIGFVPRDYAAAIAPVLDKGEHVHISYESSGYQTHGDDTDNEWNTWTQYVVEIILTFEAEVSNW